MIVGSDGNVYLNVLNILTRAPSPSGRWAYTLYDGAGGTPFIHALDTSKRQARCIDLPMLTGRQDLSQMRIAIASDRAELTVGTAGQKLAVVDTTGLRASAPAEPAQAVSHRSDRVWLLLGVAGLAAVLAASTLSLALRRRRTRLAPTA